MRNKCYRFYLYDRIRRVLKNRNSINDKWHVLFYHMDKNWFFSKKYQMKKKAILIITALFTILSCSKERVIPLDNSNCATSVTYGPDGRERKRVTKEWNNVLMKPDTVYCLEEMIITTYHKCKN